MGRAHFGPIISQEKQWWSQKVGKVFPALRVEKIGVPFYHYSFLVIIFLLGITLCKITSINPRSIPQLIYGKIWVSVALLSFIFLQWQREAGTDVFLLMFSLSVHCFVIRWHIWSLLSYIYICISQSVSSVIQSCPPHCDPMDCSTAGPPCPLPIPGVYSNSYPLSQWCYPIISSSVIPFSSHLQTSQYQDLFQWVSSSH